MNPRFGTVISDFIRRFRIALEVAGATQTPEAYSQGLAHPKFSVPSKRMVKGSIPTKRKNIRTMVRWELDLVISIVSQSLSALRVTLQNGYRRHLAASNLPKRATVGS